MNIVSLFMIAVVIGLWIVWQMTQSASREQDSTAKALQFGSNTVTGLLIMSMLYVQNDFIFLLLLLVVCLPFTIYSNYKLYRSDRRKFVSSAALLAACIVIIVSASYFSRL